MANGDHLKDWNFAKIHTHKDLFEDIIEKGATRNYNTKPSEKLHGPIKYAYLLRTNKKNVAAQVFSLTYKHSYLKADYITRF